ncbi:hypothetical protein [Paenibacillus sp. GP183]|uniref:hypothetical protein n=1 Tax=Paenibacillus sp. GP183 TaxID=1882751 RepID=UPI00089AE48A|nr:hypothetical protein [Paenibacillus sp. GP183]SED15727.1 hypothetical protein SAMN05443246_5952 [Paenibacillus sp. GP183]
MTAPLRNYTQMPPVALLVQNGNDDQIVPVEGKKPECRIEWYHYLEYDGVGHTESVTGHENPLVMRQMAMDWFKIFL